MKEITKILIANRGEIALRILKTCKSLGISTIVIYSESDKLSPYVINSDKAIFIGENNTAVLGDYAAGPSHVIPTNSAARFSSPVSIEDFLVRTSVTEIKSIKNKAKYNELLDNSIFLAELEGLYGHANALKLRRK